ncbi:hypothetical protein BVX98_00285 [bacterium F11]|nr:hypothetical protein BVX98_00285 [bacterium F11]
MKVSNRYKRKKRPQRVRFRRRYASSLLWRTIKTTWTITKFVVFGALLFGGGLWLGRFWHSSPLLKVQHVFFKGDLPKGLADFLSLHSGQNIFLVPTGRLEKNALVHFPALKKINIARKKDRSIHVTGFYRTPLAYLPDGSEKRAIDENGVIFPIHSDMKSPEHLPSFSGLVSDLERKRMAGALDVIKKNRGEFYKQLKEIKTDKMGQVKITLIDDIVIYWGKFVSQSVLLKSKRIDATLKRFRPIIKNASMRFVLDNRIVLDENFVLRKNEKVVFNAR